MKIHRWRDLQKERLSEEEIAAIDRDIAADILEMDLRAIRELLGVTQDDLANLANMTQPEVSRMERRADHKLSTLKRIVESLGGELEVLATFGDKRVRLHAAG